ncbi:hypothetical protein [Thauera chlorobenzoica]|uniref:hypothetical protein n=1 Tax=Thauera chlorobenzoica TaxID=96773 RepID=UPI0008A0471F|nr:hypothetical protein [Thauera chlorobenzoica]SEF84583.1 hypothetical protein SAMN05216242_107100 [Thauera chlorobenzoica]
MHTNHQGTPALPLPQAAAAIVDLLDRGVMSIHVDDNMTDAELSAHVAAVEAFFLAVKGAEAQQ